MCLITVVSHQSATESGNTSHSFNFWQTKTLQPTQILTRNLQDLQTSVCVPAGTWQSVSLPIKRGWGRGGGQMDDVVLCGMKDA